MNYDDYYKEICEKENCEVEIHYSPYDYLTHKNNINLLICSLHHTKEEVLSALSLYINGNIKNCYSLSEICNDTCEYGLLGSNKSTEEKIKLFPSKASIFKHGWPMITGADEIVTVYADGCFKDPVGGIWEFADPVSMVSYTNPEIMESTPNEIKLKAYIDENANKENLEEYIKNEVKSKSDLMGKMDSQGTTPRLIRDLVASLMDLTSGSGDKATPIVLVKNYFSNYAND